MGPSRAHGPSARPAEAIGFPEAHGAPKSMGPGIIIPPCPPLGGPASRPRTLKSRGQGLPRGLHLWHPALIRLN